MSVPSPDDSPDGSRRSIGARRNPASQEAILDAAEAIIAEQGLAGFSIEAVARRAKAGKPTIYRWWPNKTQLLVDVYKRLKRSVDQVDTGTLRGDCIAFLETLFSYWASGAGSVFRSIVAEAQNDASAAEALRLYHAERSRVTARLIERAGTRGELAEGVDPLVVSELLSAYAWQVTLTGRQPPPRSEIERVVRHILGPVAKQRGPVAGPS